MAIATKIRNRRPQPRPFMPVDVHISTGFDRRCLAALEEGLDRLTSRIVMSLPREGKTRSLRAFLGLYPIRRIDGISKGKVLATRTPHAGSDRSAIMYRLGARLGRPHAGFASAYLNTLITITLRAGVLLIVIDDAHSLTKTQRAWLREFVDGLLEGVDPLDPELVGRTVAVVYLAAGLPSGPPQGELFKHRKPGPDNKPPPDLDWLQFEGRLDGEEPVLWLPGLDKDETGEALAGLELAYRGQFPEIELVPWADSLFEHMLDERIDYATTGRARMDSIVKCVVTALRAEAKAGGSGNDLGPQLQRAVDILKTRPADLEDFSFFEREIDE